VKGDFYTWDAYGSLQSEQIKTVNLSEGVYNQQKCGSAAAVAATDWDMPCSTLYGLEWFDLCVPNCACGKCLPQECPSG